MSPTNTGFLYVDTTQGGRTGYLVEYRRLETNVCSIPSTTHTKSTFGASSARPENTRARPHSYRASLSRGPPLRESVYSTQRLRLSARVWWHRRCLCSQQADVRYLVLATDYDGTIAHDGVVNAATIRAIERFRASGGRPILVTGRELPDLERTFARFDLFDRIVAENGGVLYNPATKRERVLCAPSSPALVDALRTRGVPLSVGRAIVATVEPHQQIVLDAIRELGLELQVIFNKGAVMVLPSGVNKATGLLARSKICACRHMTWSGSETPRTTMRFWRSASCRWRWAIPWRPCETGSTC